MAQLRDHDAIQAKRDFFMVDPRKLSVDPTYNVRDLTTPDAREGLDELKAMVRADGVQVPLVVRLIGDDLTIVQGHRRHTVVMELIAEGEDIKAIPAIAEAKGVNDADRTFDLLRSNSGQPLAPLEIAEVVKRLYEEFRETGELAEVAFEEFMKLAVPTIVVVGPEEIQRYVERNAAGEGC